MAMVPMASDAAEDRWGPDRVPRDYCCEVGGALDQPIELNYLGS